MLGNMGIVLGIFFVFFPPVRKEEAARNNLWRRFLYFSDQVKDISGEKLFGYEIFRLELPCCFLVSWCLYS